jgi:hypothetical protein
MESPAHAGWRMLSIVNEAQLRRLLGAMLDPDEFLSDHGLRGLSRRHLRQPLTIEVGGATDTLDYEPAESRTGLFGGNSNWRGPVWFPINFLLIETLRVYTASWATTSPSVPHRRRRRVTLAEVADAADRLIGSSARARRPAPVLGTSCCQDDPAWHDLILSPYFHGDTGAGWARLIRPAGRGWWPT